MLDKIKALPEKVAFAIGLTLILAIGLLLFLYSLLFPIGIWTAVIIEGIVFGIATLFILSAAEKRHLRICKKK
ncbi:hypothetical protein [Sporosarcina sp. G11-34]|uniref:hypothetical protein n=1 Tax=Sporosarcina sp. G11-34 TaxID=2849605 RepID=UPI0022A94735|nr:hypothetical protein [Sporosarcina sp. G11-34]MCZ2258067.1 hypothetical protein [Sporosarcina sp. G11-34]